MKKTLYFLLLFSVGVSAMDLECVSLVAPVLGSNNNPTATRIRWTSELGATGYEVAIGSSRFENDILEQTIYTQNFTELLNLPPNSTIYVIIIPFNDTQSAVGCEQLMFTTSDCGYVVNPTSGMSLCYSEDAQNDLGIDFDIVRTELLGGQENLNIAYFDEEGNSIALESLQPSPENNEFNILARIVDATNCTKEVEFTLSLYPVAEAIGFQDVVVCKSFVLPDLVQGNSYYTENNGQRTILMAGEAITADQVIFIATDDRPCLNEKSFLVTINPNLCNALRPGTDYPNYFTPNGDGINDFWNLPNSLQVNIFRISVHDRYGNLISQFSINDVGWDGTFKGSPLPASDYWFVLETDYKPITGHFSLKR